MARPFRFFRGGYYHIYNRGVERRAVFLDKKDYNRFVALLYLCNSTEPVVIGKSLATEESLGDIFKVNRGNTLVDIAAYCLMPNHFHLLLYEKQDGGVSAFMQKLSTAYSMYFNTKYEHSGALFEGRFKARIVDKEHYLLYLLGYIHLNPIKLIDSTWKEEGIADVARARDFLGTYRYSSFLDYKGVSRPEGKILERGGEGSLSAYIKTERDFSDFLDIWLSYQIPRKEKEKAWKAIKPEETVSVKPKTKEEPAQG